eukprot:9485440-Pyramimonas_sp.AAC.1
MDRMGRRGEASPWRGERARDRTRAAQSVGQTEAAKAIVDAEEQGSQRKKSRNRRNKKVLE